MLPSQISRSAAGRRNTYRRRSNRPLKMIVAVLVVLTAVVVVWKLSFPADPVEEAGENGSTTIGAVEPAPAMAVTERKRPEPAREASAPPPAVREIPSRPEERPIAEPQRPPAPVTGVPELLAANDSPAWPPANESPAADAELQAVPVEPRPAEPMSVKEPDGRTLSGIRLEPDRTDRVGRRPAPASAEENPVDLRTRLNRRLRHGGVDEREAADLRRRISHLNERLVFSPEVVPDDPYALSYTILSGDSLAKIAARLSLQIDWRFLKRVNRIANENLIRSGQRIKLVTGPFHAVIDKSEYRMDLYQGEGSDAVYVCSFPVGLGEHNSTPVGLFRVRRDSKLVNPEWINPRSRQRYASDDPENPIGERWIGLEGADPHLRDVSGYGIHGTVDPTSIGRQASMGCIRMDEESVEIVYELLVEELSSVRIGE